MELRPSICWSDDVVSEWLSAPLLDAIEVAWEFLQFFAAGKLFYEGVSELRDKAHLRTALYQQKVAQHYNKNIRVKTFKKGDWVLRRVFQNTKEARLGKLGPNWEGPYKITKIISQGAYC